MNGKRHFSYLIISIVNTSIFAVCSSLFLIGLIVNLNSRNNGAIITFSVLFSVSVLVGFVYMVFDGWAFWEIRQGKITVYKLFRRPKAILIENVSSVKESSIETVFIGAVVAIECYEISGQGLVVKIPKGNASGALIDEIKRREDLNQQEA